MATGPTGPWSIVLRSSDHVHRPVSVSRRFRSPANWPRTSHCLVPARPVSFNARRSTRQVTKSNVGVCQPNP